MKADFFVFDDPPVRNFGLDPKKVNLTPSRAWPQVVKGKARSMSELRLLMQQRWPKRLVQSPEFKASGKPIPITDEEILAALRDIPSRPL